jgi:O-acetyl-ADP-ribose deacetylase (regulator of RNase III)
MAKTYYLLACPITILSLVTTGRLPEIVPEWMSKKIKLFKHINDIKSTPTGLHQTFFLHIELPEKEVEETNFITEIKFNSNSESGYCECDYLDTACIKSVYVYSTKGSSIINSLFNKKCPIEIKINPDLFPKDLKVTHKDFEKLTIFSKNNTKISLIEEEEEKDIHWIKKMKGDLLGSKMQTLVNTVNRRGVMGKGIAFGFKSSYPSMFDEYTKKCTKKQVKLGEPYLYKKNDKRWIINFPTKDHWKNNSKLEDIEAGLKYLAEHLKEWGVTSIAIPPLGCGNGNLNWEDVEPLIEKYIKPIGIPTEIYVPLAFENSKANNKRKEFDGKNEIKTTNKKMKHETNESSSLFMKKN